jgi:hypothetical protein
LEGPVYGDVLKELGVEANAGEVGFVVLGILKNLSKVRISSLEP